MIAARSLESPWIRVASDPSILDAKMKPNLAVWYDVVKMKRPVVMKHEAVLVVEPGAVIRLSSALAPA